MKTHHLLVVFCLSLIACSSNSNLTSSFGNRKYTKGVFWDNPTKVEAKTKAECDVDMHSGRVKEIEARKNRGVSVTIADKNRLNPLLQAKGSINRTNSVKTNMLSESLIYSKTQPELLQQHNNEQINDTIAKPEKKQTNLGAYGFGFVIGGALGTVGFLFLALLVSISTGGTIGFVFGLLSVLSAILFAIGVVFCVLALIYKDAHPGLALAGVIIVATALLFLLGSYLSKG